MKRLLMKPAVFACAVIEIAVHIEKKTFIHRWVIANYFLLRVKYDILPSNCFKYIFMREILDNILKVKIIKTIFVYETEEWGCIESSTLIPDRYRDFLVSGE